MGLVRAQTSMPLPHSHPHKLGQEKWKVYLPPDCCLEGRYTFHCVTIYQTIYHDHFRKRFSATSVKYQFTRRGQPYQNRDKKYPTKKRKHRIRLPQDRAERDRERGKKKNIRKMYWFWEVTGRRRVIRLNIHDRLFKFYYHC